MLATCVLRGLHWIQASSGVRYVSTFLVRGVAAVQYYLQRNLVMKRDV